VACPYEEKQRLDYCVPSYDCTIASLTGERMSQGRVDNEPDSHADTRVKTARAHVPRWLRVASYAALAAAGSLAIALGAASLPALGTAHTSQTQAALSTQEPSPQTIDSPQPNPVRRRQHSLVRRHAFVRLVDERRPESAYNSHPPLVQY
jgi:hypothetical protein